MQRVTEGFTIIEVMIVMAISIILVGVSMTFLSGQDGKQRFTQNMHDLQSKMQSWFDDVSNGFPYGTITNNHCDLGGSAVQIMNGARSAGAAPNCIFLGKAIQFVDSPATNVYAYSVFGKRTLGSGDLVSNIKDSGSVPAAGSSGGDTGNAELTEKYSLGPGTTVRSIVKSSGIAGNNSHLAGFYLSLNTDTAIGQNGETNLKAYQYNLGNDAGGITTTTVNCIENKAPCTFGFGLVEPPALSDWEICFQNDSNSETALFTILSGGGFNPSTKLEFKVC